MKEVVFAGFGGQGILTSGMILSDVAASRDMNVTWIPCCDFELRGGAANCTVKYGEDHICNPAMEEPDVLLAMNNPAYLTFIDKVKPNGIILINSEQVTCDLSHRKDVTIYRIPCNKLSVDQGHDKGANLVMTGAIVKVLGDFSEEEAVNSMHQVYQRENQDNNNYLLNEKAFKAGFNSL